MSVSAEAIPMVKIWERTRHVNPLGYVGAAILLAFAVMAIFASQIAPYGVNEQAGESFGSPDRAHLLGTDDLGFDIFSTLIYGARVSLLIGITSACAGILLATGLGAIAGFYGGVADRSIMRAADVVMVIPALPLLMIISAYSGPGMINIVLMISLVMSPRMARAIRSQILSLRNRSYVEAATSFGANPAHVMFRHLLPEVLPIIFTGLINMTGHAILMESGLAFLGLGDPTSKSWGMMLYYALQYPTTYLGQAWMWWVLPPSLCIGLLIVSFALFGYALEEIIDPKLKNVGVV